MCAAMVSKMNDFPWVYHSLNKCITLLAEFNDQQVTDVCDSNFDKNRALSFGRLIFF